MSYPMYHQSCQTWYIIKLCYLHPLSKSTGHNNHLILAAWQAKRVDNMTKQQLILRVSLVKTRHWHWDHALSFDHMVQLLDNYVHFDSLFPLFVAENYIDDVTK